MIMERYRRVDPELPPSGMKSKVPRFSHASNNHGYYSNAHGGGSMPPNDYSRY